MTDYLIGVICTGTISEYHLRSYAQIPNVKIAAVCDLNEERARAKAEKYNIPQIYTDYREFLANREIKAVCV